MIGGLIVLCFLAWQVLKYKAKNDQGARMRRNLDMLKNSIGKTEPPAPEDRINLSAVPQSTDADLDDGKVKGSER